MKKKYHEGPPPWYLRVENHSVKMPKNNQCGQEERKGRKEMETAMKKMMKAFGCAAVDLKFIQERLR